MPFYLEINDPMFGFLIRRSSDNATIPVAPGNRDYQDYLEWVAAGRPSDWSNADGPVG